MVTSTAFQLWPKSGVWPRDGEIDFPEGNLQGVTKAFMHRQNTTTARFSPWHTAERKLNFCRFILDGNIIGTSTSRVPNTPMHWVLQCETELNSTYPAAWAVANVQIDYAHVWKSGQVSSSRSTTKTSLKIRNLNLIAPTIPSGLQGNEGSCLPR